MSFEYALDGPFTLQHTFGYSFGYSFDYSFSATFSLGNPFSFSKPFDIPLALNHAFPFTLERSLHASITTIVKPFQFSFIRILSPAFSLALQSGQHGELYLRNLSRGRPPPLVHDVMIRAQRCRYDPFARRLGEPEACTVDS
ncbi:MAG: hypothetical protein JW395_0809 [Nitrospira sp.]|nr:hypothetical protein [Nitrospira sp.]